MNIEKLPSGKYRVTQMYHRKRYRITFDHKPTQKEIMAQLSKRLEEDAAYNNGSFFSCVDEYIRSKSNVLSPTTIISYRQLLRAMPERLNVNINDLTQFDIQSAVNEYAVTHSPKTVKNFHGLISSVLKMFRPNMSLHTTIPKGKPREVTIPNHEDISRILKAVEGTEYHIPFQLGCLGLRKGEILALTIDDLDGDCLTINKTMVISEEGGYQIKDMPKTVTSVRRVYIPDALASEIRERGHIYEGFPGQLLKALHRTQDELGIPRCRFHDLRHYFASYAHSLGMSDADIMEMGGWKTDSIMKTVYRHAMADAEVKKGFADKILG